MEENYLANGMDLIKDNNMQITLISYQNEMHQLQYFWILDTPTDESH
jgi:hypothetical protein